MKEIFAKTTLAANLTNTLFELCSNIIKGWQNLLQGVHAGDCPPYNTLVKVTQRHFRRRWRWLLWLLLLVLCLLLLFRIFWAVDLLTPVSAVVLSLYTIQWLFHSRLLFLHAVLVHVFNNSSCIFAVSPYQLRHFTEWSRFTCAKNVKTCSFCKHVNHENFEHLCASKKIKNEKKAFTGARTLNFVFRLFGYNCYTYCAIESFVKVHLLIQITAWRSVVTPLFYGAVHYC